MSMSHLPQMRAQRFFPHGWRAWGGGGFVLALIWGTLAWVAMHALLAERQDQRTQVSLRAKGFAEYVHLNVLVIDNLMLGLLEDYRSTGVIPTLQPSVSRTGGPLLVQLAVADETGRLIASSLGPVKGSVSIADRPHFKTFLADLTPRLYISEPVVERVSGKMTVQLSRPLVSGGGVFRGVLVASIDPLQAKAYFNEQDAFESSGLVSLIGQQDGIIRVRFSKDSMDWGQSVAQNPAWPHMLAAPSGVTQGISLLGDVRLFGFRHVGPYPLLVTNSAPVRPVWTVLWERTGISLFLAAVASIVMILFLRTRALLDLEHRRKVEHWQAVVEKEMAANRTKSQFLANVSHELRTPLNSILGFSELIREDSQDAGSRKFAGLIHSSAQHLHALVSTLLNLAKIEAGKLDLDRSEFDLRQLLVEVTDTHRVAATKKKLQLTLSLPKGAAMRVSTDRMKLLQIFNNVLNNAIKFTSVGLVSVTAQPSGGGLVVEVADSGKGISESDLGRLFEPFSAVASGTELDSGTGLGLALSKQLIELLGGSICIASEVDKGTRVRVFIPEVILEN